MIWQLDKNRPTLFPDPYAGEDDGLIAVGGDLSPERLLAAYQRGIFPWYGFKETPEIWWYCPLERFIIEPKEIHISHSMRQLMRKGKYVVTIDCAFDQVIQHCSQVQNRINMAGAWLGPDMIAAYKQLHNIGFAKSVEVWEPSSDGVATNGDNPDLSGMRLVGGLYGVSIGPNFFGESMFSLVPSASKLALIHLAQHVGTQGGIIDCQFETPHLRTMGGKYLYYDDYLERLNNPKL